MIYFANYPAAPILPHFLCDPAHLVKISLLSLWKGRMKKGEMKKADMKMSALKVHSHMGMNDFLRLSCSCARSHTNVVNLHREACEVAKTCCSICHKCHK